MSPQAPGFSSMKASRVKRMLIRQLGYRVVPASGSGSHEWLESTTHGRVRWAYHPGRELSPIEVRNLLVKQVGLSLERAREVASRG